MDTQVPQLLFDLFQAYYDARKNKRKTKSAIRFELNFEREVFQLYEDIISRSYAISPSFCFIVKKPVMREIFAVDFRDRVVHHLLFNYLNSICENIFINDSYACRIGKGTSYGIRRVDHFIRSISKNYTGPCYVLKLDISGYFMSINRAILFTKVKNIIIRSKGKFSFDQDIVLWLLEKIIFHDHIHECVIKGTKYDWEGLPRSKSLFYAKKGCGLPIGNLTSQLFGNIYLNDFDHSITKIIPKVLYGRYVDDMIFVSSDKKFLLVAMLKIRTFLEKQVHLIVHPKKIYLQHYTKGVDFLGVTIRAGRMYPRHRMKGNLYQVISLWNRIMSTTGGTMSTSQIEVMQSTINSYLGAITHCRTYRLRKKALSLISLSLLKYFSFKSPYKKIVSRKQNLREKLPQEEAYTTLK